jgi:uncharacterized protein YdeI (YjbR/CyaY-like superfamily)
VDLETKIHCASREAWREWLRKNHASCAEVWLHYYKKHTGKPSVTYRESVEEALCFGWIDGLKRRVDDDRYAHRFTPRKAKSKWSPLNIRLAEEQIANGRMSEAGLEAYNRRVPYDGDLLENRDSPGAPLPEDFAQHLAENPAALANFEAMSPGYRGQYVAWIGSAKREETRRKRIGEAVRMLERNRKPGMQ